MRLPRLVLLLFLVSQAYDGLFTYVAVRAHGVEAEGNLILGAWMTLVGPTATLVVAKLLAAASGLFVYARGLDVTLAILTGLYLFAAIGPWLYVYANWP
jgi:hypothetical protein